MVGELAVCASLLAIAVFAAVGASGMPFGEYNMPGPGIFPFVLATMLGAASLARIASLLRRWKDDGEIVSLGHPNVIVTLLALCLVALLLEELGFLTAAAAFLFVLFRRLSGASVRRSLAAAVAASLSTWLLFDGILDVHLPRGALPWG